MTAVTIVFPNIQFARMFMTWLCECGEQHYFEETEEYAVHHFDYNFDHLRVLGKERAEQRNEYYTGDNRA